MNTQKTEAMNEILARASKLVGAQHVHADIADLLEEAYKLGAIGRFEDTTEAMATAIYRWAKTKGWWDKPREKGTMIALMHSELSEALEEIRDNRPPIYKTKPGYPGWRLMPTDPEFEKTKVKPEGEAIELADLVIRVLDYCAHYGIDLGRAIHLKMAYNEQRPYRHGGKTC